MTIDDGLALAPSASGYWPDDNWLADKSDLPILLYQQVRAVRLEFWLPPGSRPRRGEVEVGMFRAQLNLRPDQVVSVDIPIQKQALAVLVHVTIDAEPATPPDVRKLGAILAGVRRLA